MPDHAPPPSSRLDLGDPATYAEGVPHDEFARLRREAPVVWVPEPPVAGFDGGPGFWAVTRFAEVAEVSRHPEVFSSHVGATQLRDETPKALRDQQQMMINLDPPDHTKLRRTLSKAFTPRRVAAMTDSLAGHADRIVARLEPGTAIDLVEAVSAEMPLLVLADLLGVPPEDRRLLYDWTNAIVGLSDPAYGGAQAFRQALFDMFEYVGNLITRRRQSGGDDIWSLLVNVDVDGVPLSQVELERFFQLLVIAGNETTRNLISAAVVTLDAHPDEQARLREAPDLLPSTIEEVLRFHSPVIQFRRTATEDTELAGQTIAAGDKVVMYYVSANRDDSVFVEPDRFDIGRDPNGHCAFGVGGHFCLGAGLGRLEARVLLERLLGRFPDLTVSGPPVRFISNFINGYRSIPVDLGRAA